MRYADLWYEVQEVFDVLFESTSKRFRNEGLAKSVDTEIPTPLPLQAFLLGVSHQHAGTIHTYTQTEASLLDLLDVSATLGIEAQRSKVLKSLQNYVQQGVLLKSMIGRSVNGDRSQLLSEAVHHAFSEPSNQAEWTRFCSTLLNDAYQAGSLCGIMRDLESANPLVYRRLEHNPCVWSQNLYQKSNGNARIFEARELLRNGLNNEGRSAGKPHETQWLPVVGSTHPWCRARTTRMLSTRTPTGT